LRRCSLADDAEICGCNGVSKGKVTGAIAGGAHTLDAVRSRTKASAQLRQCTAWSRSLLQFALGDEFAEPPPSRCANAPTFTHEDVRRLIKAQELKSIPPVMQELGWKTPAGAHPAARR
jgi:nitrite reductase (NADH) large subunit